MKVSRAADVAIRALVHLAMRPPHNPVSIREICAAESVSRPYLTRIFDSLKEAGFVFAHGGGRYCLCCSPDEITLRMILEAIESPEKVQEAVLVPSRRSSSSSNRSSLHPAWREVQKRMVEVLDSYTLESFALDAQYYL